MTQNELIQETNRLTDIESRFMVAMEEGREGRDGSGVGD